MKKKNLFSLALLLMAAVALTFTSCSSDDDGDATFTVTFTVANQGGTALTNAVITLNGVTNAPGDYVFEDVPEGAHLYSVALHGYLTVENSISVTNDLVVDVTLEESGVIGKWISEGNNVAPLLGFFDIVKITAEFREDNTYRVFSYTSDEVETLFEGVFTQERSNVGNIWTIYLEQGVPSAVTSEGIFEVTIPATGPRTMRYEVIQTNPALGTAPTPEEGFGSSSGGTLGQSNVQNYVEIVE